MIKFLVILALAVAANGYFTKVDYNFMKNDKDLVYKQKFVLEMLRHVYQPLTYPEYFTYGKTFVEGEVNYVHYEKVKEFFDIYINKMLPRGEIFSVFNEKHLYEVNGLFHLFYYSKDFTVFMKNVVWARMHLNEGMFVYAFVAAVIHRTDMYGITLPSPYEITPHMFIDNQVLLDGYKYRVTKSEKDDFTYLIWKNNTNFYDYFMNKEYALSYFTEDVGLNSWYYYFHMDYPFWLGKEDFGYELLHRGEKYLYFHQQLLARYYMERLSNGLGEIPTFDYDYPIHTGYYPRLAYFNGVLFPMRPNYYNVKSYTTRDHLLVKVYDYERRIRDILDRGFIWIDDKKYYFTDYKNIEYFGNLIHGNVDSYDYKFYRYFDIFARLLVGGSFQTYDNYYKVIPSVLEHYETSLRDPVFYQLYKRIIGYYYTYKNNLPHYTHEDIYYPGVKFNDVKVSKLVTYFDFYDIDVSNGIDIASFDKAEYKLNYNVDPVVDQKYYDSKHFAYFKDETWKYLFKYRTIRLNHEPFTFNFDLVSDKDARVVIRTFLAPKYDYYGNAYSFVENRDNWVEFDKFVYDLKVGKNVITRTSRDFYYTIPDGTTYRDLYKRVMTGYNSAYTGGDFMYGMSDYYTGFPDRLLLPKGTTTGFPVQFFFIVTPFTNTKFNDVDFTKVDKYFYHNQFWDNLPYGYPFDRFIPFEKTFYVDNVYTKDVFIFHRKDDSFYKYVV